MNPVKEFAFNWFLNSSRRSCGYGWLLKPSGVRERVFKPRQAATGPEPISDVPLAGSPTTPGSCFASYFPEPAGTWSEGTFR